ELLTGRASPAFVVHLRGDGDHVRAALVACDWVTAVEPAGPGALRVTAASLEVAERSLVAVLADAHAQVASIVPAAGDLEHVFLELTAAPPPPAALVGAER